MRKNADAAKNYEKLKSTLVLTAMNSLAADPFPPPTHSLTGDTTVEPDGNIGVNTTDNGKGPAYGKETCLCGEHTQANSENGHISRADVHRSEDHLTRLIKNIEVTSKRLGGLKLESSNNCLEINRIISCVEELMVLQTEALISKYSLVEMQESSTSTEQTTTNVEHTEKANVELQVAITHARMRRRPGLRIFSAIAGLGRRRSKKGGTNGLSEPQPAPGAGSQPVEAPLVPTQPVDLTSEPMSAGAPMPTVPEGKTLEVAMPIEGEAVPYTISLPLPSEVKPKIQHMPPDTTEEDVVENRMFDELILDWTTLGSKTIE
jgi:hypothetical protein